MDSRNTQVKLQEGSRE